ncbi:hypothetical protein ACFQZI_15775 [Mucilaginibacter lutimaris]|uniref:Uncharacterized protein n=1 Tax=Mucilaginibacter lutimaris TaxID=931629 RepID=A0ABW2ZJQ7_9SPHI
MPYKDMKLLKNFAGGLAGAIALNILHEIVRRIYHDAPRVELIGEEAVTKISNAAGTEHPTGDTLYLTTLAGDVISNAMYYSAIGAAKKKHLVITGLGVGLSAGFGALKLTKPMGLSDAPVTRTNTTKALTVAWYTFGGLVAALTIKSLRK